MSIVVQSYVFLVVSEFGLMNVYTEESDAIEAAGHHHSIIDTDNPGDNFCPVWVVQQYLGHGGESFPVGMFPDLRGTESPGEWVSAFQGDTDKHKPDFPWPKFSWKGAD